MKTVAIVKDKTEYYPVFKKVFQEYGFKVRLYDVWEENQLDTLLSDSFDAFVWRAKHDPPIRSMARRFIHLFDQEFKLPTYPNWHSYWHYDDKIAQSILFKKHHIPAPRTNVFVNKDKALKFAKLTDYPLIYKCAHGAGSSNVGMLSTARQAKRYINKAFKRGIATNFKEDRQKDYVYFQEFLSNNSGDYRLVCYGDKMIHGFFRENRPHSFFASGSGRFQVLDLDESMMNFIVDVNKKLLNDIMSYDLIRGHNDEWVITEMSVVYGDLTNDIYNQTPVYKKENGAWIKMDMPENHIDMTIKYIINDVWHWL